MLDLCSVKCLCGQRVEMDRGGGIVERLLFIGGHPSTRHKLNLAPGTTGRIDREGNSRSSPPTLEAIG